METLGLSSSPAQDAVGSMSAHLNTLPAEVLDQIISVLPASDLKCLRLVCRRLQDSAVRPLFQTVVLSPTEQDRNNILNVGKTPRLAELVEQLLFYELDLMGSPSDFDRAYPSKMFVPARWHGVRSGGCWVDEDGSDEENPTDFTAVGKALKTTYRSFWLVRSLQVTFGMAGWLWDPMSELVKALEQMPRLSTLISQSMPYQRVVSNDKEDYPVVAEMVQNRQIGSDTTTKNAGLILLLDAMRSSTLNITSIYWADESFRSSIGNLRPGCEASFRNLRLIDLCISNVHESHEIRKLAACLHASSELQSLQFCVEKHASRGNISTIDIFDAIFSQAKWPHLKSLVLVEFLFGKSFNGSSLIKVLRNHSATLRHVGLERCMARNQWVNFIETAGGMLSEIKLESIWLTPLDDGLPPLEGRLLLDYINTSGVSAKTDDRNIFLQKIKDWIQDPSANIEEQSKRYPAYGDEDPMSDTESLHNPRLFWVLRRFDYNIIFWSTEDPDEGEYETEIWKCIRKDGTIEYSDEPLEYFSDWDSDTGEDLREPTPFGWMFDSFAIERHELITIGSGEKEVPYPRNARIWDDRKHAFESRPFFAVYPYHPCRDGE